jgi:hypothetical protein
LHFQLHTGAVTQVQLECQNQVEKLRIYQMYLKASTMKNCLVDGIVVDGIVVDGLVVNGLDLASFSDSSSNRIRVKSSKGRRTHIFG